MYSIDTSTGKIHFPDGFVLAPPYDDPRYIEYAEWVSLGNSPEEFATTSLYAEEDVEVTPAQARIALATLGVYDDVLALMNNPNTPTTVRIKWEFTLAFRRNDDDVIGMATLLGWDKAFLDLVFTTAKNVR